nr:MAG TPA: hypothetical protein [Caudoviricetes sp.]
MLGRKMVVVGITTIEHHHKIVASAPVDTGRGF